MTKKEDYYIKFATMLAAQKDQYGHKGEVLREIFILRTADIFAEDNPRFDHKRFFKAADIKP